jgi:hypothetical protein
MDPLDALLGVISSGLAEIKTIYSKEGISTPSLDDPYSPNPVERKVGQATNLVVAAAFQLIATLRHPSGSLVEASGGVSYLCCC